MSRAEQIRRLASRTCGVASDEVEGVEPTLASRAFRKLAAAGQIFPVRIDAKHFRYFRHVGMRDAWVKQRAETQALMAYTRGTLAVAQRAPWTSDTPADMSRAKITVCPSYAPRFQPIAVPGAPRSFYGARGQCGVEAVAR
jgi:hypothetical protein